MPGCWFWSFLSRFHEILLLKILRSCRNLQWVDTPMFDIEWKNSNLQTKICSAMCSWSVQYSVLALLFLCSSSVLALFFYSCSALSLFLLCSCSLFAVSLLCSCSVHDLFLLCFTLFYTGTDTGTGTDGIGTGIGIGLGIGIGIGTGICTDGIGTDNDSTSIGIGSIGTITEMIGGTNDTGSGTDGTCTSTDVTDGTVWYLTSSYCQYKMILGLSSQNGL